MIYSVSGRQSGCSTSSQSIKSTYLVMWQRGQISNTCCSCPTLLSCTFDQHTMWIRFSYVIMMAVNLVSIYCFWWWQRHMSVATHILFLFIQILIAPTICIWPNGSFLLFNTALVVSVIRPLLVQLSADCRIWVEAVLHVTLEYVSLLACCGYFIYIQLLMFVGVFCVSVSVCVFLCVCLCVEQMVFIVYKTSTLPSLV